MDTDDPLDVELVRELQRVFGDDPNVRGHFLLLPLIGPSDALAFLRTVPSGTPFEQLPPLASAYRAAHPVGPITPEDGDGEAAI